VVYSDSSDDRIHKSTTHFFLLHKIKNANSLPATVKCNVDLTSCYVLDSKCHIATEKVVFCFSFLHDILYSLHSAYTEVNNREMFCQSELSFES